MALFKCMLPLLLFCAVIPISYPQCLTASDEVRKVSEAAYDSLLHSELQFSGDLLHTIVSLHPEENVFFSPSCVYRALVMAYFISANETDAHLRKALHLAGDQDKLDVLGAYFLEKYYQKLRSASSNDYQLSHATRVYVAKKIKVRHCMKVLFEEEIYPANFEENLDHVVKKINHWVATQTNDVIKDFFSKDSLTRDTQVVLLNAAYFKGTWKTQFDVKHTSNDTFYLSNGTKMTAPFMKQTSEFKMKFDEKLEAEVIDLPYVGEDISMFVILPLDKKPTALQGLLSKLNGTVIQDLVTSMKADDYLSNIAVIIPKFSIEHTLELVTILDALGAGDMFQPSADLSSLTGSPTITFSKAIHKAKVRVDEKGTEAAAVTAFISARTSTPTFIADHPFIYFIYHKTANIILFFGVYNHPPLS